MPTPHQQTQSFATMAPQHSGGRRRDDYSVAPASGLVEDAANAAAIAAADRLQPTVNAALRDPAFAQGVGAGIVAELRKPESSTTLQQVAQWGGQAAAKELNNVPFLIFGGIVAGFVAGAVVGAFISPK